MQKVFFFLYILHTANQVVHCHFKDPVLHAGLSVIFINVIFEQMITWGRGVRTDRQNSLNRILIFCSMAALVISKSDNKSFV